MNAVEIDRLRKEYRALSGRVTLAVDSLQLQIRAGGVFGLLGPNGSGKTTTIRCLLGLARPTAGSCRILGADPTSDLSDVIGRVGSIVEAPALFPNFTARRNLELLGAMGRISSRRIDEVIELVGLEGRERDLVKTYSLGMRQRLGLAAALLNDPELLILDEPANGLDPAGIKEVRHLLRRLGDEGRTVIVSSHILGEVEQTCDRVAILHRGRCVTSGPVEHVLERGGATALLVRVRELDRGLQVVRTAGLDAALNDSALRVETGDGEFVAKLLSQHGLYPSELRPVNRDLETVFLELTSEAEVAA